METLEKIKIEVTNRKTNGSRRVQIFLPSESTVEQAHAGATNINAIMAKYRKTGQMPMAAPVHGLYGDFAIADDYHATQNRLIEAEQLFMSMPSEIRKRFANNAGQFFEFCNDPGNLEEAVGLGLIPKPVIEPPEEPVAPKPAPGPSPAPVPAAAPAPPPP